MDKNIEKYLPPILVVEKSGTILDYTDSAGQFFMNKVSQTDNDQDKKELISELLMPVLGTAIQEKIADLGNVEDFPCYFTVQNQSTGTTWTIEIDQNSNDSEETPLIVKINEKTNNRSVAPKQKNDKKFQAIFDNTLDGIILSDFENGTAIECNGRIIEMLKTTEDGIINGSGVLSFSPEFQPSGDSSVEKMKEIREEMLGKKSGNKTFLWRYKKTDGTEFDAEVVLSILEADGRKLWLNIIRDLSDRVAIQKELADTAKKFKSIFNQTFHLTWLIDKNGLVDEINGSALELLQEEAETMSGQKIWETAWWANNEVASQQLKTALERESQLQDFVRFQSNISYKEESYTFDFSIEPLKNEDGEVIEYILEGRDITALNKAKEEVLKSERLYRSIIRNTQGLAVALFRPDDLKYILVEGNYIEMMGWGEDRIIGNRIDDILDDKKIGAEMLDYHERAAQGELIVFEISHNNANFYGKFVPIREGSGEISKIMLIVQDVTEIKATEAELKIKVEELERKQRELEMYIESNSELENFAYTVSHDLKEPLRNILGFTQLIEKNYRDQLDHIGQDYLNFIIDGGTRMNTLITSLLEYSRVNTGEYNFKEVDIEGILAIATGNVMNQILEHKAAVNVLPNIPKVFTADLMRMSQIFQNLIANAIRFRKRNEEDLQPVITIGGSEDETHYHFTVKDNGVGIAKQNLDQVFALFRRFAVPGQKQKGSGIGLAICKKIVEQHQGQIGVNSIKGEGAEFYFSISKDLQEKQEEDEETKQDKTLS